MAVYSRSIPVALRTTQVKPTPRRAGMLVTLALVVALMSLVYLVQIERVATQGYQLEQLSMKRTELTRQNENYRFSIEQAQSLESVRARAQALGMQPMRADQAAMYGPHGPAWSADR